MATMINKELYRMAAVACCEVYDNNVRLGMGTEYNHFLTTLSGKRFQVVTVAGTDDLLDMVKNLNLLSWKGIKLSAYLAAKRIMRDVKLHPGIPVIVCGHSLGGAVAVALKRMFKADYCVAFAPARMLRYWANRKMENTTIFIDPNDPVPKLGCISFGLALCKTVKAKDDHFGLSAKDHAIEKWVEFTKNDTIV